PKAPSSARATAARPSSPPPSPVRALLVDDPRFDAHAPRGYHPERPERLTAARQAAARAHAEWSRVEARPATDAELARVHDPRFVESLGKLRGQTAHLDADTYVAPASVDAA